MIIRQNLVTELRSEGVRGGIGPAYSKLLASKRNGFPPLRALALNRLPPGSSWGPKRQKSTGEFFIIVSGQAEVIDNGQREMLEIGDMVWVQDKQQIAIRNAGQDELLFLGGVYQEPGFLGLF